MAVRKIYQENWQNYFDTFAKLFLKDDQPEYADIKVLSGQSGAQTETSWQLLEGITYNDKDNVLNIKVENLNRMILNPQEIYVDEVEDGWINSMEIVEEDGTKTIIETR
jgi:hypothetical protein